MLDAIDIAWLLTTLGLFAFFWECFPCCEAGCTLATATFDGTGDTVDNGFTEVTGGVNALRSSGVLIFAGDTEPDILYEHGQTFPGGIGKVTISLKAVEAGGTGFTGEILGAYTDVDNCIMVVLSLTTATDCVLSFTEINGGVSTPLMTDFPLPGKVGVWIPFTLCWTGEATRLEWIVDGETKAAVGLSTLTGGLALRGQNISGGQMHFDDLTIEELDDTTAGCPTCRVAVGFDELGWGWLNSCHTLDVIISIAADVTLLERCILVCGGNNDDSGDAVRFAVDDWPAVKEYVENGGRLFLCAEHDNIFSSGSATLLNDFLTAMGSTLSYSGGDYNDATPACSATYHTPGAANIAAGINFTGARFGEISGGTTVWLGTAGTLNSGLGKVAVAVEQIGDGFIFISGDSNHGLCSGYCDFIERLIEYQPDDII